MPTNWLTKELTLDLLSITIGALVKIHDTIDDATKNAPAQAGAEKAETPAPTPAADTETTDNADSTEDAEPAPTLPQIQTALRTIAQAEGIDWIQNELFASFQITNITDLPTDHYPLAWELITTHQDEMKEAA